MRVTETIFFPPQPGVIGPGTVEVRSRPLWVAIVERWFLEVHELVSHTLKLRVPYEDPYWGEPFEAAFHVFYTWAINHDTTIDKTARYTDLREPKRKV